MAFNNLGHAFIPVGGVIRWGVYRNGGGDFGAQYVACHPENADAELIFRDHSKVREGGSGKWAYWMTVTNGGPNATWFSMQGGGYV
jgi:hypothetical protein